MLPLLLSTALAAPLTQVEPEPVRTLITGVHVFRPDGELTGPHDVMLDEGRITAIGKVGEGFGIPIERAVDGTGGTLVPGLIDVHVHLGSVEALPRVIRLPDPKHNLDALLYAGVTTVLDPGMAARDGEKMADKLQRGRWHGPDVYWTGKPFAAPGGHPKASVFASFPNLLVKMAGGGISWDVQTAQDVTRAVAKQGRTELMKIMLDDAPGNSPTISDEAADQVVLAARALDSTLVAHVGRPEDVTRALDLGVDALVHMPWAGAIDVHQSDALARQGIAVAPTLVVWDAVARYSRAEPHDSELVRTLRRDRIDRDADRLVRRGAGKPAPIDPWTIAVARGSQDRVANAKLLQQSGVRLMVGSDTPIFGVPTGAGTHLELELLGQAGWSNTELLLAATKNNALLLDDDPDFGAIAHGFQADVLLVEGNPVDDLGALQRIRAMWVNGRHVQRVRGGTE